MKFGIFALAGVFGAPSLVEVDRMLTVDPSSPEMIAARKEEVSFLQHTLKSMEMNQAAVVKSNNELDHQVREGAARLDRISKEVKRINEETERKIKSFNIPFSLLETKSGHFFGEEGSPLPSGPVSILELARAKAAASEKRYREAMKKLQADKAALIKDEKMHRVRAAQERRHMRI
jgi:hypothetical protein